MDTGIGHILQHEDIAAGGSDLQPEARYDHISEFVIAVFRGRGVNRGLVSLILAIYRLQYAKFYEPNRGTQTDGSRRLPESMEHFESYKTKLNH